MSIHNRIKYSLAVVTLIFMPSTIIFGAEKEDGLKETVFRYNQALIESARTGNTTTLEPLTTKKIVTKTYAWIHSWQDSNLYMRAKLNKLNFEEIRVDSNASLVRTQEEWSYDYYDAQNKKKAMPTTQVVYEMKYTLYPHQKRWIINDIKVVNEKSTPLEKVK